MELSATAEPTPERGTRSPTDACQDGLLSAVPQPMRKVKLSSNHGVISPSRALMVNSAESASMKNCATSITRRRGKLSAMAPPSSENSMIGSEVEA